MGAWVLAACTTESGTGVEGNCVGSACNHGTTGRTFQSGGASSGKGGNSGGSTGAASSSGSSSSGASSSSSGSSSSSSGSGSGGSSGGDSVTCSNITGFVWDGGSCQTSWYGTRFADLGTCAPLVGATVETLDPNGVPISGGSATTDATGEFLVCLPPGSVYTPYVQAANYPPSYLSQQKGPPPQEWVGLISTDTLGAVTAFLGGNYNGALGVVAVFFQAGGGCVQSGWNVALSLPDGGAFPDAGFELRYLDSSDLPDPNLTATSTSGSAIFYNIDTSISSYVGVSVTSAADAGGCQDRFGEYNETGLVYVAGNALSYFVPFIAAQ
jgi:hypothetical protein